MFNDKLLNKIWSDILSKTATPQENPIGFVLGGQSGAGKSNLIKEARKVLNNNAIVINGDDFRKYHPLYKQFQESNKENSPKQTAEFSKIAIEAIFDKAVKERYNIIIEGTFRTSQAPLKTLQILKNNGYEANVLIQTCHKDISWASCLERYNKMLEVNPKEARYTPKEHHDLIVENLAKNILEVYKSGLADRLQVFVRFPQDENLSTFKQIEVYNSNRDGRFTENTINKYLLQKAKERNKSHIKSNENTNSKGFER